MSLLSALTTSDLFVFPTPHRARGGRREREVSKDKVTYPLDEEGDNLNSYGEGKKKELFSALRVRWTQEKKRAGRKSASAERIKNWRNRNR